MRSLASILLAVLPPQAAEPLAPASLRLKLRTVTSDVARAGDAGLVERMRAVLAGLGDDPDELEKLARSWEKTAAGARPGRSARAAAANRLRREMAPLVTALEQGGPRREELARWILELDSAEPRANAALGRVQDEDGSWRTPEELAWKRGAKLVADRMRSARMLDFDVERAQSANPALLALGGGHFVRAEGIEIHSSLPPEALDRVLRQALRALAFSRGILHGKVEVPAHPPRRFLFLASETEVAPALEEARSNRALMDEEAGEFLANRLRSFHDGRGWRTSRWRAEADLSALILWELTSDVLGPLAQPCLRTGHLNWVCLSFLGTSMPMSRWLEAQDGAPATERTSARRGDAVQAQALWRSARQSLYGCRSWMVHQVRAGKDPPWARAMLDQDGKITDANLLKTTLVCEMLQQEGRLWGLMEATREGKDAVSSIEKALGEPLPLLEERWRRWLDPVERAGVLQFLERAAPATEEGGEPFTGALETLNRRRSEALAGQEPEFPLVALEPDLCRAAELHARYLTLNPGEKQRWPQVHEERTDRPGFSPQGSLAGSRAVIAFTGSAEAALEQWLGTFYHRLPLLDPGLFGAGFGASEEVVVLDVGSLVVAPWKDHVVLWPPPGAEGVPRTFAPEIPNPVPGADLATCGYPVTVQLFFLDQQGEGHVALELSTGDSKPVDCHLVSPEAPLFPELAPRNAWGLIPEQPLAPKTRYTARAVWEQGERSWSFETGE